MPTPAPKWTQTLVATLALVGATAIWGSTFLVTKQSLPEISPASFLVWRFGLAAIALLTARPRQLVTLTRTELHRGLLLGVSWVPASSSRPLVCWAPVRGCRAF